MKLKRKIHLEIQQSRKNPVGVLRTTFWDKRAKQYRHTQHGRITHLDLNQLKLIQAALRGEIAYKNAPDACSVGPSREFGASHSLLQLVRNLKLPELIYTRREGWRDAVLAMIVGRVVYQGSKLSLCNIWKETCLWELCGISEQPLVQKHCYLPLDRLLERQEAIQKKLTARHMDSGSLVLYDITSTYFEGAYEQSNIVTFGYNRDQKKGHEQVVIGLVCTAQGCPLACEVFAGNTKDESTVTEQIETFRKTYGINDFGFVGDRGMITQGQFEKLHAHEQLQSIGALTHAQMKKLVDQKIISPELFDETKIAEIQDPDDPEIRYCLNRNPFRASHDKETRQKLLEKTEEQLIQIAAYKKRTTVEKLGARIGKALAKYKVGKLIEWQIEADPEQKKSRKHQIQWTRKQEKIKAEEALDGCYIIRSDVPESHFSAEELVSTYKSLTQVEQAFRTLKTVQLETRPIYHKKDDRIRAHIFLCMLAYYLQWHMKQRLAPLFETDGKGSERCWSIEGTLNRLKQQGKHLMGVKEAQIEVIGGQSEEQREITTQLKSNFYSHLFENLKST